MAPEPITVLLVEPNAAPARGLERMLADGGNGAFTTVHRETLAGALERLAAGGVDAVVLGAGLPEPLGPAAAARLSAAAPHVPVVVLADAVAVADGAPSVLGAIEAGAEDVLSVSDVDARGLVRSLRLSIARKRAEQAALRQARERATALEAEAGAQRLRLLEAAGRALLGATEVKDGLSAVARYAVPAWGTVLRIDLVREDGTVARAAEVSAEPDVLPLASEVPLAGLTPEGRIYRLELIPDFTELGALGSAAVERGLRMVLAVPLIVHGKLAGALAVGSPRLDVYGAQDLDLARALGALISRWLSLHRGA